MELIRRIAALRHIQICKIHTSSAVFSQQQWRREKRLPKNKTSEGPLTDAADYTFLDGRPTPIGTHQKRRLDQQRLFTSKIVEYTKQIDFAKNRLINMEKAEEEKRAMIMAQRLKPKGNLLFSNKVVYSKKEGKVVE